MIRPILSLVLAAMLLFGCGREGFVSQPSSSFPPVASSSDGDELPPLPTEYELTMVETKTVTENIAMHYRIPDDTGENADAARRIGRRIEEVVGQLPDLFDMESEQPRLELSDRVVRNENSRLSIVYEGTFTAQADAPPSPFCFGMTFSLRTGEQLALTDFVAPNTLAILLLDAQSAQLLASDAQEESAQRSYVNDIGLAQLAERIIAAADQQTLAQMLDASYYLEGGKLVVILSVPASMGSYACLMLENASA